MMPLLAGALSGAISLFGSSAKKKEEARARAEAAAVQARNQQRLDEANSASAAMGERFLAMPEVNLKGMVEQAEAAGFNPLTVLRAGGMSLYQKAVQLPGMNMMLPQHVFQESPLPQVRSGASVVAGALSDGFSTFMSQTNIVQSREFQREMLNASLKGVQAGKKAGNKAAGSSFYVPGMVTSGTDTKGGVPLTAALGPQTPKAGDHTVTNPWRDASVDAGVLDAEMGETRYADVMSNVLGLRNYLYDLTFNVTGRTAAQRRAVSDEWFGGMVGGAHRWNAKPMWGGVSSAKPMENLGFASPSW